MHELSLAMSVMDVTTRQLTSRPGAVVTGLEIEVGQHSGVDLDSFRTAMNSVVRTSEWPEAEIDITVIPAEYQCLDCGHRFYTTDDGESPDLYPACPECHARCCLPVSGREFRLKSLRLSV